MQYLTISLTIIENPRVDGSIPPLATSIPAGFRGSTLEFSEIRVQFIAHKPPYFLENWPARRSIRPGRPFRLILNQYHPQQHPPSATLFKGRHHRPWLSLRSPPFPRYATQPGLSMSVPVRTKRMPSHASNGPANTSATAQQSARPGQREAARSSISMSSPLDMPLRASNPLAFLV